MDRGDDARHSRPLFTGAKMREILVSLFNSNLTMSMVNSNLPMSMVNSNLPTGVTALLSMYNSSIIGGSYVVSPETANDIDVCVNQYEDIDDFIEKYRCTPLTSGNKKYEDIDHNRLVNVYEYWDDGVKVNILVIGAVYWPAYLGAIKRMWLNPNRYSDRASRIALHKELCKRAENVVHGE